MNIGQALILIAAGCLAGCQPVAAPPLSQVVQPSGTWATSQTEAYRGKRDDIHFATARTGFYGTGGGDLFKTDDGGASWTKVWSKPGTFIRAVGFVDEQNGFLGNVGDAYPNVTDKVPLYRTRDGGRTWTPVNIGDVTIEGICAIDVLRTKSIYQGELRGRAIIHAGGRVSGPAKLLRSTDGGNRWTYIDLSDRAGMILDVKFIDANTGFVFAASETNVAEANALILKTRDGGKKWREVYRSPRKMENSWKGHFVDARTGYATIQTYDPKREQQVIVKTVDAGESWTEMPLTVNAKARQFGIGFATVDMGWVGTGAGGFETRDGGSTWTPVPIASAANKIRTRAADGTPMIYAVGTQVQLYR